MDLVLVPTLDQILGSQGPLETVILKRVATQALEFLTYLESKGVVHRDIKPGNMVFRKSDQRLLVLIDFGLANHETDAGKEQIDGKTLMIGHFATGVFRRDTHRAFHRTHHGHAVHIAHRKLIAPDSQTNDKCRRTDGPRQMEDTGHAPRGHSLTGPPLTVAAIEIIEIHIRHALPLAGCDTCRNRVLCLLDRMGRC
jgi:serine/threonine protein kinase